MANKKLKFGVHDFINAQPLLIPLKEREQQLGVTLVTGSPASLADQLREGKLDLAMIPSVEYLKDADQYRLIPGIAVASRGPVDTVLLASHRPLAEVESIAVDVRSRTSVALLQILFGEVLPWNVFMEITDPNPVDMLKNHDAALIIGDPAFRMRSNFPKLQYYDLSEQWFTQTQKTFVHAVVAARNETHLDQDFLVTVQEAKTEGLSRIESIAQTTAKQSGLTFETCLDYLSKKIIYDLGKEELVGLQHFRDICSEKGVIDKKDVIRFVQF